MRKREGRREKDSKLERMGLVGEEVRSRDGETRKMIEGTVRKRKKQRERGGNR